jgi:methyl-accepting chemotaxis protein
MRFRDLPVGRRVGLGFGAVVAVTALLGAASIGVVALIDRTFVAYERAAALRVDAQGIDGVFAGFLGAAREYAARNSPARLEAMRAAHAEALAATRQAAAGAAGDDARDLRSAADLLAGMGERMDRFAALRSERNDVVRDVLRGRGTEVRRRIEAIEEAAFDAGDVPGARAASDLLVRMMLARDYAGRYLDTGEPAAADRAAAEAARSREALRALEATPAGRAQPEAVRATAADLDAFEAAIGRVVAVIREERALSSRVFDDDRAGVAALKAAVVGRAAAAEAAAKGELRAEIAFGLASAAVGILLALALGTVLAVAVARSIVRPVREITSAMGRVSGGDLDTAVPGLDRKDEVGAMAAALGVFVENARERRRLEEAAEAERRRQRHRQDEVDQTVAMFGRSIQAVLQGVRRTSDAMTETASGLRTVADRTNGRAGEVTDETTRAAEDVAAVASAAQELTAAISEVGRQIDRASEMAASVRGQAERARADVAALDEAMAGMGEVVGLIASIAGQTNLLALNATIEAARAGEAGKGFAVVAQEVKNLAVQTAKATEDISGRIQRGLEVARTTAEAVSEIDRAIAELAELAAGVAAAATQQESATAEIARSVDSASAAARTVLGRIRELRADAEVTQGASAEVSGAAGHLSREAATLAEEVGGFLEGIADGDRRDSMERRAVSLQARVLHRGAASAVRVVAMSPALAEIAGAPALSQGEAFELEIPGLGAVKGRVVGTDDGRTVVQLPMDRASLDRAAAFLAAA